MGNSASSGRGHHEETVDFGYLTPQGIYTGARDWNQGVVTQCIVDRRLAPFYRPLEDYEESWDDEQILAARKDPPDADGTEASRAESVPASSSKGHAKRPSAAKEPPRHPEAAIYRGAVECPICFLYYPPNINHSRCCDQAICTECFVQIKRVDPTTTHLVSEPAACPYCVQENFGVVYTPPNWRTGLGSEGATPPSWPDSPKGVSPDAPNNTSTRRRRKSFGYNDPEVVTVDQIHPDWEAKLAAVRAAVARRANRRIIMRQVGDRLIPVGVTSGRVHALPPEEGGVETPEGGSDRGSRRSRRRQQNQELNQFLGSMGIAGQDLEELMVMEAMRLSLLEHEAQQRKQQEEEAKKQREEAEAAAASPPAAESPAATATTSPESPTASPPDPQLAAVPEPARATLTANANPAPPPRASTPSQGNGSSRRASRNLSPPADSDNGRRSGRSTPTSQYGAISAAVLSAASTASALATPDSSTAPAEALAVSELSTPPASEPTPAPEPASATVTEELPLPEAPSVSVEPAPAADEPSTNGVSPERPAVPPVVSSSSSSLPPSSYDTLPSSPESTISSKPLLDTMASPPSAEGGGPAEAAST